jgi:hypothetical protein
MSIPVNVFVREHERVRGQLMYGMATIAIVRARRSDAWLWPIADAQWNRLTDNERQQVRDRLRLRDLDRRYGGAWHFRMLFPFHLL